MAPKLKYFPQIDVLRALAIIGVILSHWFHQVDWIFSLKLGRLGVDLFFVISGFLITRILFFQKEKGHVKAALRTFYARRVLRIFPVYYLVVFLSAIFHDGLVREALPWNLTYTSNFFMLKIEAWVGVITHFWSLSVEEQFYLLWPFLILLFRQKRLPQVIMVAIMLGVLSRLFFWLMDWNYLYVMIFPSSCLDVLGAGALLAWLYETLPFEKYQKLLSNPWALVGGILLLALMYIPGNSLEPVGFRLAESFLFFFIVGRATLGARANKPLVFLGKISYSTYLFHNFIPGILLGMTWPENIFLKGLIEFLLLILISWVSYRWVEKPINSLKKHFPY
ncbi:MAG: acyltransferase [Bacteroidia bacterium]|nr:acyltransferase [Bacteroidia bacterium]